MKKHRKTLLIVLCCLAVLSLVVWARLRIGSASGPYDYDDPESLCDLAERTELYLLRAGSGRDPDARKAALKEFEDIALLDVSMEEKARIIRERFPEESFWTGDLRELLKSAEAGDPGAQYELGCLYLKGTPYWDDGVDPERGRCIVKSDVLAAKWFRRAALQGHVKAQNRLAYLAQDNGYTHPVMKNHLTVGDKVWKAAEREIRKWVEQARNNKDPVVILWNEDHSGREEVLDDAEIEALALAREAAGQGHVKAMQFLADRKRVSKDEAAKWYRRAAELGSVDAMMDYAYLCERRARYGDEAGDKTEDGPSAEGGTTADAAGNAASAEANLWRRKAFDLAMKHLDAGDWEDFDRFISSLECRNHLDEYLDGEDKAAFATRILDRSLERLDRSPGDEMDFFLIRGALSLSKVLPPEENNAVRMKLLPRRAETGGYIAQEAYAECLLNGLNAAIPQNKPEGIRLLRKMAGFGHYFALTRLGQCFLEGDGVPKDRSEGIKWLKLAAEQGDDSAMNELCRALWDAGPWRWPEALNWSIRTILYPKYDSLSEFCLDKLKAMLNSR